MIEVLRPDWPAPGHVRALITTRQGGVSRPPYDSLNLATHVGDDAHDVARNRALLIHDCRLPEAPFWLNQVHGCHVADSNVASPGCEADAVIGDRPGRICAVLTADCLPLLICDRAGSRVCAVHAGWRGLAGGVIEAAVSRMAVAPAELLVWLGPAIGPDAFEVGGEVREAFVSQQAQDADAFRSGRADRWLADIYRLARQRLARLGVGYVGGGDYCTFTQAQRFFSYRRDGVTGRMASLIWLERPA
ncbi:MAG: peptidoglycan editing factor PgeF [Candidatus Thiodiazotropha sp.]